MPITVFTTMEENDGLSRPVGENPLSEREFKKLETEADVRLKEDTIRNILSPYEGYVMGIQSLLVWENPRRSFVLLLCVNGFVWLMVTSDYNVVFKVTLSFITIVTVQTFYKKVWPDIKVEPKVPPLEGWIPLEPELVQFHDLCHYAALTWQYSVEKHHQFWNLRKDKPGKFCFMVCAICLCVAVFGLRVSGGAITYLLVSCLVTIPGFIHYNFHQQLFVKMKPYLTQMEHSMEVGGTRHKRRRLHSSKQRGATHDDDRSTSDSELEEFIPSPGPALDAALAHAAATYENTPGSSSRVTPVLGLIGGLMPKGVSMELTDDDLLTDNENSQAFGPMEDIPAYDDSDSKRKHRPQHSHPQPLTYQPPPYQPPTYQPPPDQPLETLLTRDMSETHFKTIPSIEFSNGSELFSSEDDMLDTSPEVQTEDAFDNGANGGATQFPPVLDDLEEHYGAPETRHRSMPSDSTKKPSVTLQYPSDQPKQEPSLLPRSAADLLSQTVASVTAFLGRDRSHSQEGGKSTSHETPDEAFHQGSGPSSLETDLSDYEVLDESEIDNERNSTEQQPKDSSFSEFFSSLFGKKS